MTPATEDFLERNQLPESYLQFAQRWFDPLLDQFSQQYQAQHQPQIWGINGCQGSGKSTLADYLCSMVAERHGVTTANLSLDDFYLPLEDRLKLAETVHPLLATRGVPGTHDIGLAINTLKQLVTDAETRIPRFDKSRDDRAAETDFDRVQGPAALIILEGWCLGAQPQTEADLQHPINDLERLEDNQGIWRQYINRALAGDYQQLFAMVDQLIMLRAPSFDTVFQWRWQQETKLLNKHRNTDRAGLMTEQQVLRFIQYFQRITEQSLEQLPAYSQYLFQLEQDRQISSYSGPEL
jgi:D-glycerate 3-kinase